MGETKAAKSVVSSATSNTLATMLPELERSIIDFERATLIDPGPKDRLIEMTLGLTSAHYYERLVDLVSDPLARAYDPLTMRRVQRLIEPAVEVAG